MIADYWVIRRKSLDVADLYRPRGRYFGMNAVGVAALTAGVLPNIPGFMKSARLTSGPATLFDALYPYAWFIGFGVAFGLFLLGTAMAPEARVPREAPAERPLAISLAAIGGGAFLGLCGIAACVGAVKGWEPNWFCVLEVLHAAVGGACLWGIWRMRRWGVVLYLCFSTLVQVAAAAGGTWGLRIAVVPVLVGFACLPRYRQLGDVA
jgi:hypothetical protein